MKKISGLRRRWLMNAGLLVLIVGLVCVLAITSMYANFCYDQLEQQLNSMASTASVFMMETVEQERSAALKACLAYAEGYPEDSAVKLWFLTEEESSLPDVSDALRTRGICSYRGDEDGFKGRVIAVSCPVYAEGEYVGVLRFITDTRNADIQIWLVFFAALAVLALIMVVVLVNGNYRISSILVPLEEINEKAQRIAAGSYGIQIQTEYTDEVGALAKTINELSSQISQNEKTQTEFISSLSHELRTPLTAINGWSETLLSGESLDPDTSRGMKIISREAKRLTEMVVDLLDYTRIQDGRMTLNMEQADIRAEFEDTVFMYGSRLAQDGVELSYLENDDDIPEISCDSKRLRQVLLNILDNAAKHGGIGKQIDASIHHEDDFVVIRIRDYGPGIPEDEIPLVKKKFYKGSSKARGSGIGLAVSDEIVQMHGGTMELSNAEGGGTLVTVTLPAAQ